jgi:hypothetical protein
MTGFLASFLARVFGNDSLLKFSRTITAKTGRMRRPGEMTDSRYEPDGPYAVGRLAPKSAFRRGCWFSCWSSRASLAASQCRCRGVHIVVYCGDLGYGVARGAEMLSLMLLLGIISRIGFGIVSDAIGGSATLLIGSFMQGVALMLYLTFDGLTSLFVLSGVFGLFQGGIVPMYAVICRELLPPREAGTKIGLVVSATIFGMAFGGYASGLIYDLTSSYRMAFLNGVLRNAFNFATVGWLFWRRRSGTPTLRLAEAV